MFHTTSKWFSNTTISLFPHWHLFPSRQYFPGTIHTPPTNYTSPGAWRHFQNQLYFLGITHIFHALLQHELDCFGDVVKKVWRHGTSLQKAPSCIFQSLSLLARCAYLDAWHHMWVLPLSTSYIYMDHINTTHVALRLGSLAQHHVWENHIFVACTEFFNQHCVDFTTGLYQESILPVRCSWVVSRLRQ